MKKEEFMKNWKSKEMSKRLLIIVIALVLVLLPIAFLTAIITGSDNVMSQYIIGAFGLASIAVGFYFWKAKNENLHKYANKYSEDEATYLKKLNEAIEEVYNE